MSGRLGFTGTRDGMTPQQRATFSRLLTEGEFTRFAHGDCIGADAQAHDLVRLLLPSCLIVVHPPIDQAHRALCIGDEYAPARTHFARNRNIVLTSTEVIGISLTPERSDRGGTWYTLDYAAKRMQTRVVWPDGTIAVLR